MVWLFLIDERDGSKFSRSKKPLSFSLMRVIDVFFMVDDLHQTRNSMGWFEVEKLMISFLISLFKNSTFDQVPGWYDPKPFVPLRDSVAQPLIRCQDGFDPKPIKRSSMIVDGQRRIGP
jgi:hypothetical protein